MSLHMSDAALRHRFLDPLDLPDPSDPTDSSSCAGSPTSRALLPKQEEGAGRHGPHSGRRHAAAPPPFKRRGAGGQVLESARLASLLCAAIAWLAVAGPRPARAQTTSLFGGPTHVALSAALSPANARAGESAQVIVTAKIDPPYHMYSLTQPPKGPQPTTIELASGGPLAENGPVVQPPYRSEYDQGFRITDQLYEKQVSFAIPVQLRNGLSGQQQATVSIHYQLCNQTNCLIPQTVPLTVRFTVAPGAARPDHLKPVSAVPPQAVAQAAGSPSPPAGSGVEGTTATSLSKDATRQQIASAEQSGLLAFIALAFGAGFLALLTPCVFPMIPITVSFFAKRREQAQAHGVRDALAYSLGIIGTFTLLGIAVAVLFKASGIRVIANSPYLNIGLAILFVVLALNLMGAFEITLPSGLANRANAGARRTGILGPVMMGLTFTLTSFTCTVAFVGTLLAAAAQGSLLYPVVGMLAFSTAFASPFFLLALFPHWLARMPRSGAWMVTVKGFMGFLEMAAALKFLSNADLYWSAGLITRPLFLAVWAALAAMAGLYLLGWLRIPHDDTEKVGWTRRGIGAATLAVCLWLLAGLDGAALGALSPYLPPSPYPGRATAGAGNEWPTDYVAALTAARASNRLVFINFTGVNCTNCRQMEAEVFPLPQVQQALAPFQRVELFTDRATDTKNAALMWRLTHVATLPVYVVETPEEKVIKVLQDRRAPDQFVQFLKAAAAEAGS